MSARPRQEHSRRGATLLVVLLGCLSPTAFALTELTGQFGHHKQVYGAAGQNRIVTKTYAASASFYFLSSTALDVSYAREVKTDIAQDLAVALAGADLSITGSRHRMTTTSYGVGIKQALAPRRAFLRPTFSLGYARQDIHSASEFTLQNQAGLRALYRSVLPRERRDSVFSSLSLQVRIGRKLALKASVHTIFKAFEFDQASDNIKYLIGLTWFL